MEALVNDYSERVRREVGLKRKLRSENAKLLLECLGKKLQGNE
jgi:hypothetical protein